ncbi:hypothetical protein SEA_BUTTON_44 [Gordonia phage Button]|nr:hypothetical protein SEA_BUTTON_44 [Gordonia phage Button]
MNEFTAALVAEADAISREAKRGTSHEDHNGWSWSTTPGTPFRCGCGAVLVQPSNPNKEGV